jgi:hypothetical protein
MILPRNFQCSNISICAVILEKNHGKSHKAGSRVNPTVTAGNVGTCSLNHLSSFFTAFPNRDKLNITKLLYIYMANLQYSASDQLLSWLMNVITKKTDNLYIYIQ